MPDSSYAAALREAVLQERQGAAQTRIPEGRRPRVWLGPTTTASSGSAGATPTPMRQTFPKDSWNKLPRSRVLCMNHYEHSKDRNPSQGLFGSIKLRPSGRKRLTPRAQDPGLCESGHPLGTPCHANAGRRALRGDLVGPRPATHRVGRSRERAYRMGIPARHEPGLVYQPSPVAGRHPHRTGGVAVYPLSRPRQLDPAVRTPGHSLLQRNDEFGDKYAKRLTAAGYRVWSVRTGIGGHLLHRAPCTRGRAVFPAGWATVAGSRKAAPRKRQTRSAYPAGERGCCGLACRQGTHVARPEGGRCSVKSCRPGPSHYQVSVRLAAPAAAKVNSLSRPAARRWVT